MKRQRTPNKSPWREPRSKPLSAKAQRARREWLASWSTRIHQLTWTESERR
jgi:hypothetical protein